MWTARWDLLWLWTLPVAGILILADHSWWPYAAMVGGGAWIDTGGREGAKWLGVRQHGVNVGTLSDQRKYASVLSLMIVIGALAIVTGLVEVV